MRVILAPCITVLHRQGPGFLGYAMYSTTFLVVTTIVFDSMCAYGI